MKFFDAIHVRFWHKNELLEADTNFPESMKDFLFANPDSFGKDLFAINIQRGRDHGLAAYNDYREFFGMQRARDFSQLLEIPAEMRQRLRLGDHF